MNVDLDELERRLRIIKFHGGGDVVAVMLDGAVYDGWITERQADILWTRVNA